MTPSSQGMEPPRNPARFNTERHGQPHKTYRQRLRALKITEVLTALLVLITGAYVLFSAAQWNALERQVGLTSELASHQFSLLQRQLAQSQASHEGSRRAWVLVKSVNIIKRQHPDMPKPAKGVEPWGLVITLVNPGESPGMMRANWIQVTRQDFNQCPTPSIEGRKELTLPVLPHDRASFVMYGTLAAQMVHDALTKANDNRTLIVHGTIYYEDIFKRAHEARFCKFLLPHITPQTAVVSPDDPDRTKAPFGECQICQGWD